MITRMIERWLTTKLRRSKSVPLTPDYRGFAAQVMHDWPEDHSFDMADLQLIAARHGLIYVQTRYEPCDKPMDGEDGAPCACKLAVHEEDWVEGVRCYNVHEDLIDAMLERKHDPTEGR